MHVEITKDAIRIYKTKGAQMTEVVGWSETEWMEDPEYVVPAIANAIVLALKNPKELERILNTINPKKS